MSLFDLFLDVLVLDRGTRMIKDVNSEHIKAYIIPRLATLFPCASKHLRILRNSRNSPMFLFCFAIYNGSWAAQELGL